MSKTAEEILTKHCRTITGEHPSYVSVDEMKEQPEWEVMLLAMEEYANQFRPTHPPADTSYESEAEKEFPTPKGKEVDAAPWYDLKEVVDFERKAYIKGRQKSVAGEREQIAADAWDAAFQSLKDNTHDAGGGFQDVNYDDIESDKETYLKTIKNK